MSRQHLGRAIFAAMFATAGIAQADLFSPGELARPHQQFEGISNCTKCHPAGDKLSQETCLTPCHTELKPQISAGKGLHGRLSDEKRACETCHHDHQGRDFQMVDWGAGKKAFDHRRTGWALKGAHLKADCEKCHERRLISWPVAIKLLETRPHTFLGVDQSCEACHFDEHRGQQKEDCAYCHNEKEWKPAPGFDHDTANYALKGKHKKVKCEKCHPAQKDDAKHGFPAPKSETFLKLTNLEYSACTDCHKDPHENRFGPRCASCHTVDGWHIIRNVSKEREFHEKTRYPLKGAHIDVECRDCHGPYPGQAARFKNMKFEDCTDCHADAHEGQIETKRHEAARLHPLSLGRGLHASPVRRAPARTDQVPPRGRAPGGALRRVPRAEPRVAEEDPPGRPGGSPAEKASRTVQPRPLRFPQADREVRLLSH